MLAAGLMAFVSARAIVTTGRERAIWIVATIVVFGAIVGTGTRTSAILLAAPLVQLAFTRHRRQLAVAIALLVVVVAGLAVAENQNVDLGVVGNRFASAVTFVQHPRADPSWQLREAVTKDAISDWRESPILGVGPGHVFHLRGVRDGEVAGFQIDSPTGYLAKFGLIGIPVLLASSSGTGSERGSSTRPCHSSG
jgi:O-antigen ligase